MAFEDQLYWILHDWVFPFPLNVLWLVLASVLGYQFLQWFSSYKIHSVYHVKEGGVVIERPGHQSADGSTIDYKISQGGSAPAQILSSQASLEKVTVNRVGFPLVLRKGIREKLIWLCPEGLGQTADWRTWFSKKGEDVSNPRSNEKLARDAVEAWIKAAKIDFKAALPYLLMGGLAGFGVGIITLASLGLVK